jgi:hypothetical protein
MARKDLLTRLADAGEDAIARLGETPGADRFMGAMSGMRDRVDELQKRVRGIEDLERRVAALEARLAEPPVKAEPARRRTTRKTAASGTSKTGATRKRATRTQAQTQPDEGESAAPTGPESPG